MKYEKMSITELEQAAKTSLSASKSAIVEATKILRYLQKTKRYKENPRYAKEPFKVYLEDQFGVKESTYNNEWVRALPFEEEAKDYGVGLVSKTIRECGAVGAKRVFAEAKALDEKQGKIVTREKLKQIIENHQDPKHMANIKKEYTDWKAMYQHEAAAHEATKRELKKAMSRIAELNAQVEKLKPTAESYNEIRQIFDRSKGGLLPEHAAVV